MATVNTFGIQDASYHSYPERNLETSTEQNPNIVVVIPAYNEARHIQTTIARVQPFASTIIVVDDGSSDDTADRAQCAGALVVQHTENQGKGIALMTGFKKAHDYNPDVVVTIDADGQHIPDEIPRVIAPVLQQQADIVVGSRYLEQTSDVPMHRIWGHYVFNLLTNYASGVHLTDSQSGFRAFSSKALDHLSFQSSSFSVESEMQFIANAYNLRITEVPITILYHDQPKRSVIRHGFIVLNGILNLVKHYRPALFFKVSAILVHLISILCAALMVLSYSITQSLMPEFVILIGVSFSFGLLLSFTGNAFESMRGVLPKRNESWA